MAVAKCSIACAYTTEEKHIYIMNRQQTMTKIKININIIVFLVVASVYSHRGSGDIPWRDILTYSKNEFSPTKLLPSA